LPSEDAVVLERVATRGEGRTVVACPMLPRIANFDDLDPLKLEPSVDLVMVPPGRPIPAEAALVVLPGSKATLADLAFSRAQGWDIDIAAHHRRGGLVLGLCGGFQMLGTRIADPLGIEGPPGEARGLGLLEAETVLAPHKTLRRVAGRALGADFDGYEMHMGETRGPDCARPFALLAGDRPDGAISADGRVLASYVHGLLGSSALRAALLHRLGASSAGVDHAAVVDTALDEIAEALERHVDVDALLALGLAR
jgi:adenosylcobyric acid synthase